MGWAHPTPPLPAPPRPTRPHPAARCAAGTDIYKALALGARAVGLGKPVAYAMSAYGQAGIEQMLAGLRGEFENTMRLMGCKSLADIRAQSVDVSALSQCACPASRSSPPRQHGAYGSAGGAREAEAC